ncbi:MAG: hypothetical protein KDA41_13735 [Planctomycetales bacterium]|nr:hypothetical protein [Planctomycetales bacterium]
MLNDNKVEVDSLPTTTLSGRVVRLAPGAVGLVDGDGKSAVALVHPQGVSHISVSGDVPTLVIQPGVSVRFAARVDEQGRGTDPVDAWEIVTLGRDVQPTAVGPNKVQTIVGTVTKRHGDMVRVTVGDGELKSLTFMVAPEAKAVVRGSSLDLLSLGDDVVVQGHSYAGVGSLADRTIFANELTASKPTVSKQTVAQRQ